MLNIRYRSNSVSAEKVPFISLKEARRLQGPVYEALVQELNEANCTKTAKYFEYLVAKENKLIERRVIINRISNDRDLLIKLTESFMRAEQAMHMSKEADMTITMKLFHQNLLLLEHNRDLFNWLLTDIYEIVVKCVENINDEKNRYDEWKARFFHMYAVHLESAGGKLRQRMYYLDIAFELSLGHIWKPGPTTSHKDCETLHEAIAHTYAEIVLKYPKTQLRANQEEALTVVSKAIAAVGTPLLFLISYNLFQFGLIKRLEKSVDGRKNMVLLNRILVAKIYFLLESNKIDQALNLINRIKNHGFKYMQLEFIILRSELLKYEGLCYYSINNFERALESFIASYSLAVKSGELHLIADLLHSIGRSLAQQPTKIDAALNMYVRSKNIYTELNDIRNTMKLMYLIAKINADQIFPTFIRLIKSSDFCSFYKLRQWKNQCKTFWLTTAKGSIKIAENVQHGEKVTSWTRKERNGLLSVMRNSPIDMSFGKGSDFVRLSSKPFRKVTSEDVQCLIEDTY